jgi:hypothetical protein
LHQEDGARADPDPVAVLQAPLTADRLAVHHDAAGAVLIDNQIVIAIATDFGVLARNGRILDDDSIFIASSDRHDRLVQRKFATEDWPSAPDQCRTHLRSPSPAACGVAHRPG